MSINWQTATADEIVEAMKIAVQRVRSQTYEPLKMCYMFYRPFKPMFTSVKKGPRKGQFVVRIVRGGK